jgi:hypothetical protein
MSEVTDLDFFYGGAIRDEGGPIPDVSNFLSRPRMG